jgi:hypothetical protein
MKKIQWKNILTILLFCCLLQVSVFAENTPTEVIIPVTNEASENDTEIYNFRLDALDDTNPMPEAPVITIQGTGEADFGPIVYSHPGDYEYLADQIDEGGDETVYHVTVHVTSDEAGVLSASVYAEKTSKTGKDTGVKEAQISFYNLREEPETTAEETTEEETTAEAITPTTATPTTAAPTTETPTTAAVTTAAPSNTLVPILGLDDTGTKIAIGLIGAAVLLGIMAIALRSGSKKEE